MAHLESLVVRRMDSQNGHFDPEAMTKVWLERES
jgi:hypothetical protein